MNKNHLLSGLALTLLVFSACKKDENNNTQPDPIVKMQVETHSEDQSRVSSELDALSADFNTELEASTAFSGKGQDVTTIICGANVTVDTMSNPRTITIAYNGTNCGGFTRTGSVVLSMAQGVKWKNANAVVNVSYQNVKITRVITNKSITFNGQHTYTNVTGGLLYQLAQLNTITHTLAGSNLSITFPDSTTRNWSVGRQRTFTYGNGVNVAISGTHSANGQTGIAEWGTDRFGVAFTSAITSPVTLRQDCSFRVTGGSIKHTRPNANAVVTFGLNAQGAPVACPQGVYYYKVVWTGPNGNSVTHIAPY